MAFPYIYTFYSYKGGVGRSMALVNAAYALAGYGRHVLMVDMDLEAPGMSGFLERGAELDASPSPDADVLSVLEAGLSIVCNRAPTEEDVAALPSLEALVCSVPTSKRDALQPKYGTMGRLDLLPARTNAAYTDRLGRLGLSALDPEGIARLSNLLRAWFKRHRFLHPVCVSR
jgi:cellulose biosynthesis protein BcsQ